MSHSLSDQLPTIFTGDTLIAGTRVTGAELHLGTYYGWIRPIIDASQKMNVCVFIADYQSLDVMLSEDVDVVAQRLTANLRSLLPAHIPIIRESQIPSMGLLAQRALTLFSNSHLRRVGSLRKLQAHFEGVPLNTLLYPAMMVANVLALGGTHTLDKPEGVFQHVDILNDILHRGSTRFGWPDLYLQTWAKPKVNIPSLDGTGPMKRERQAAGYISAVHQTEERIDTAFATVPTPGYQAQERLESCKVIWPMWGSIRPTNLEAIQNPCATNHLSCEECVSRLAKTVWGDLSQTSSSNECQITTQEQQICNLAEERLRLLLQYSLV